MSAIVTDEAGGMRPEGEKLAFEQLRLALRNLKPICWLMPPCAAVVCVMFARWVDPAVLVSWLALVTLTSAYLGVGVYAFLRNAPEPAERRMWATHATMGYFLFVGSWSSVGLLFWRPGDELNQMLIMLVLACSLAANAALVGSDKTLTAIGYAVYGLVLICVPLRESGTISAGLAALAFFYACYLAYMSRQVYSTARELLLLRDYRNELIEALAQAKTESDRARARAEAASRAKSDFLANMSHELRTPLNAILGFSEMIYSTSAAGSNPARSAEYARLVHESGNYLLALVNDILDVAKIEAGRFELRETDTDVACLVDDTVRLMADRATNAGLTLATDIASDVPLLSADERALRQILINLLSNALKFTPSGGEVAVFSRVSGSGDVILGVRDTGTGIALCDQPRVFQSFGQGRHDIVTGERGTGLGLTIVKGLTEAHGGYVNLASIPGKGTCVTITLPAARARAGLKRAS
jgi:two-component system, cell cycle sensor histidine kinase PleC